MPFEIIRNDIVKMKADAIVNTANPAPVVGSGVDMAIHQAAGPELLKAREAIGELGVTQAAATPAFGLDAKYVIHVAGPSWEDGAHGEKTLLAASYRNALAEAAKLGCESIAFPLLSTGNYGVPKDVSMRLALAEFSAFLLDNEMQIYLTVFGEEAFKLSSQLFSSVQSYIDENYVAEAEAREYGAEGPRRRDERRYANRVESYVLEEVDAAAMDTSEMASAAPLCGAMPAGSTLEDYIAELDAGFAETLLALIDKTGQKDSEVYKRANISKQVFSKLRNDPNYRPTKQTAIAFALALGLNLDETQEFLAHAGFTLTKSSKFDLVIMYCIEHKIYNIVMVNNILYEQDQVQLGEKFRKESA